MEEQGLVKVEEFKELITNAPAVLAENQESCNKAIGRANELIKIAEEKMDDVIDAQLSAYIEKAKKTVVTMTERRKPFTQIMTAIAKEFTLREAEIKPYIDKCQSFRDAFATKKMIERREAERLVALKLAKDSEAIEIEKYFKTENANKYIDYLLGFKKAKTDWFNLLTLDTIDQAEVVIKEFDNNLSDGSFSYRFPKPVLQYHTEQECLAIFDKLNFAATYANMAKFKNDCVDFMRELTDMIPSKKQQLEELEAARIKAEKEAKEAAERQRIADEAAAEAKRKAELEADLAKKAQLELQAKLEAEKAEKERLANIEAERKRQEEAAIAAETERIRQQEEKKRQDEAAEAERARSISDANIQATAANASVMVDSQATLFSEAPKVKEGYTITVMNQAGYLLLAQFWFENEGKNLSMDKIESMTFARIKSFCEKYAAKNETFIESKLLIYKPIYKAK